MSYIAAASIDNFFDTISEDDSIKLIKQFSAKSIETNGYKYDLVIIKNNQANTKTSKKYFFIRGLKFHLQFQILDLAKWICHEEKDVHKYFCFH